MGDFFRSEEMALCQLFIQPEAAYASVSLLGEKGIVQFRDLNGEVSAFQRKFVSEVRRCEEIERKLRYIGTEVKKDGVPIPDIMTMPTAPNPREIIDLEAQVERTETEIQELSNNAVNLKSNFMELSELKHVLQKTDAFFQEQEGDNASRALIGDDQGNRTQLGFVAGVVPRERVFSFERMLWRISRGNVFLRRADIEEPLLDPSTGNLLSKTVFVAFYQGEQLKSRVKKVCAGFHATLYPCPCTLSERNTMVQEVKTRLEDLNLVLNQTDDHRQRVLVTVARELTAWTVMVKKMKAIYHTMNMFNMDVTKKCLIGECWVPSKELGSLTDALNDGGALVGSTMPSFLNVIQTAEDPPTFNRTNKFTKGFQILIDNYGVASYREVNPALYTIITFPFLFGVMFGDLGHGLLLSIFAIWMVLYEESLMKKKSTNEIWNIFFGGRYIILLMGLFSVYTGIIYNDMFSRSLNIFGSSWKVNYNVSTITSNSYLQLSPAKEDFTNVPYPFGVDPVWQLADNKIIFLNTYKMKLSIILGVIHMIFGVCLSVANHLHRREAVNILLEFLPQVLFLVLLFFYMVIMIFMKFFLYSANNPLKQSERCAPSVLIMFINMMLLKQPEDKDKDKAYPDKCDLWMYDNQDTIQKVILFLALACIPVMLLGKPFYLLVIKRHKKEEKVELNGTQSMIDMQVLNGTAGMSETPAVKEGEHGENESATEIFIHQIIHTIEYVLSTVSHTASYLRLWALSLAHAQLSEVLWNMVLQKGLQQDSYVGSIFLYAIFAAWACLTVSILVLMEGLSAFLHTLRLHWVEFMSKFYTGLGYPFQPFSLLNILDETEETVET
ncbi:V-type proton ATPase 116 kDa subunit a-like isoform X2 [Cimex lectularius]|uniref:V-type proton ATPase subunit a n=1 Tax=Cimex lectularius TaxID=79782 RepID=A0A8I6RNH5_CIMLE|nr:V-type proton ATPase 116 kDa subunit a-like isoform X2 [Cimex lectularius]